MSATSSAGLLMADAHDAWSEGSGRRWRWAESRWGWRPSAGASETGAGILLWSADPHGRAAAECAQIGAVFEQMSGPAVTQGVRCYALADTGALRRFGADVPDRPIGDGLFDGAGVG